MVQYKVYFGRSYKHCTAFSVSISPEYAKFIRWSIYLVRFLCPLAFSLPPLFLSLIHPYSERGSMKIMLSLLLTIIKSKLCVGS